MTCVLFPCVKVAIFTLLIAYVVNYQLGGAILSIFQILLTLLLTAIILVFVGLNVEERGSIFQLVRNYYEKFK